MPIKKTKARLIFWIIVDMVVILVSFVLLWEVDLSIKDFSDKTIKIKNEINKEESSFFLRRDFESNIEKINIVDKYIVEHEDLANLIDLFEKAALNNNLKIEVKSVSFVPIDISELKDIELVKMNINVVGEWKNTEYFLEFLENYPLKLDINNALFDRISDEKAKDKIFPQWLASFEFTVVKFKEAK